MRARLSTLGWYVQARERAESIADLQAKVAEQARELESSEARATSLETAKETCERRLVATEQASRALALEHEQAIAREREDKGTIEQRFAEVSTALREMEADKRAESEARAEAESRAHRLGQSNEELAQQHGDAASEVATLNARLEHVKAELQASTAAQQSVGSECERLRAELESSRTASAQEALRCADLETQLYAGS